MKFRFVARDSVGHIDASTGCLALFSYWLFRLIPLIGVIPCIAFTFAPLTPMRFRRPLSPTPQASSDRPGQPDQHGPLDQQDRPDRRAFRPAPRHGLRRSLLALQATLLGATLSAGAYAQGGNDYPARPVRIVVGYTPGGATDVIARLVATGLSEKLGQPFVVDNRPGAGSNIASEEVARAKPDGYTLLVTTIQNATNMSIYKNLRYDTEKNFVQIAQFMASPSVLVLAPNTPATDLKSFIALAKSQPNKLSYASTGTGGSPHLAGAMLNARAGIDLLHVAYKGTAPALVDVMAGNVSASFMTTLGVLQQMKGGQVRPIAIAYSRRLPELPNVPTMAEAGLPDFEVVSWNGLAAPAGTPPEVVARLSRAVTEVLQTPEMRERVRGLGGEVVLRSQDDFTAYVKSEIAKWRAVATNAKITLD